MRELFADMGMDLGPGGRMGAQGTPEAGTGEVPFQRGQSGDIPQGAMPDSGGGGRQGFGGGQGGVPGGMAPEGMPAVQGQADPSLQATRNARMGSRQITGVNPVMLNALIELLQGKIEASG